MVIRRIAYLVMGLGILSGTGCQQEQGAGGAHADKSLSTASKVGVSQPSDLSSSSSKSLPTQNRKQTKVESPEEVASKVKVTDSEFDAQIIYAGPDITIKNRGGLNPWDGERLGFSLSGSRDKKTGQLTAYKANISIIYGGERSWRFYESVSLPGGQQLPLWKVHSEGDSRVMLERVAFPLSADQMNAGSREGIKARINARTREGIVIFFPPEYVQGFLAAVKKAAP